MSHDDNYKPIIYLTIVLLLFYCSSLFSLIPIYIFNINVETCDILTLNFLRLFPNLMVSLILFFMYRKDLKRDFSDLIKNFGKITDTAFKYWFAGFLCMMFSNIIIGLFSPVKIATNEESVRGLILDTPVIAFFFISICAPFMEEVIFRKTFKDSIKNKWLYVIVSGLVFGALHIIGNINSLYDLLYLIPYSSLGFAFALTYYKTNNIFSSISMHFLHNTLIFILYIIEFGVI